MSANQGLNPNPTVELFYDGKAELAEAPFFEPETNQLLWVDIESCTINFLNVDSGKNKSVTLPDKVGAVIPIKGSTDLLVATGRKLCIVDRETGAIVEELASVEEDKPNNLFNDSKCDTSGRVWAGTLDAPSESGENLPCEGNLYSYSGGKLTLHVSNVTASNGLGWSPDNTTMYFIDTIPKHIYTFDFNPADGTVSNQKVFADFALHDDIGFPDGMCTDIEGRPWVASYVGGCVTCWDPTTGKMLLKVEIPGVKNVTSCCFGGPDYSWLFVTSNRRFIKDLTTQPNAGGIFVIKDLGTKGLPANRFNLVQ